MPKVILQRLLDLLDESIEIKVLRRVHTRRLGKEYPKDDGMAWAVMKKDDYKDAVEDLKFTVFRMEGLDK